MLRYCLRLSLWSAYDLVEKWFGRGEFSGEGGVVRVAGVAFEAAFGLGAMLVSLVLMSD